MLKASALYIVIILALVIAIFSASLISVAYFYRLEYQKNLRHNRLLTNLNSGFAILLSSNHKQYDTNELIDLFGNQQDSILLRKERWGVFDVAVAKSFTLSDTLKRAFLIGNDTRQDQTVLYLSDEDRPLSVSGKTAITGEAVLPKAGIKQAYVEGRPYEGKKLVYGSIKTSGQKLPELDKAILTGIEEVLVNESIGVKRKLPDSLSNSFFNPPLIIRLDQSQSVLGHQIVAGKIMLVSDTILTIEANATLRDVIVYAPAIVVKDGFKGNCQLFATDSIIIGKNTVFNYPSCAGVIKMPDSKIQAKVVLGENAQFSGILLSYEASRSDLQTMVSLGKNSCLKGEVYAVGYIRMNSPLKVDGKVSCNRFLIQTPNSLYENYLIDITLNRPVRSKYYLTSSLFKSAREQKKILKWIK